MSAVKLDAKPKPMPCVACGKDSYFTVGWLAPTRLDACEATVDLRPACSAKCAFKVQRA